MKKKTLLIATAVLLMLILCWGVAALASARNAPAPVVIDAESDTATVDLTRDLSGIELIPERAERAEKLPNGRRAKVIR